jgi:3-hydroxyisobutyrate dehydrogenase-like beta-hydroxyacid dehydrogenase
VGSGTVYKLINNLMGAIQIAGLAEGLAIAEQAGLDMNLVLEAIENGVAASPQVLRHSRRMVARNFSGATFTAAPAQGRRLCRGAGGEPAARHSDRAGSRSSI